MANRSWFDRSRFIFWSFGKVPDARHKKTQGLRRARVSLSAVDSRDTAWLSWQDWCRRRPPGRIRAVSGIWRQLAKLLIFTCRAIYTAAFPEVVYVLDVFMKKSKSGIRTPQADKDRVRQRFTAARQHYDDNYRKRGGQ